MKKLLLVISVLVLIPIFLLGCQSNAESALEHQNISRVGISESTGFGKVNPEFFEIYQDEERLLLFTDPLKNASKEEGIVDMIAPQYDLDVSYEDGANLEFHLWVGESGEKSTLMQVDDTHTIYTVSRELTNKLIDLLKK